MSLEDRIAVLEKTVSTLQEILRQNRLCLDTRPQLDGWTPELSVEQIEQLLLKCSMRVADLARHYNYPADWMTVFLKNNGFEIIRAGWVRAKPDSQK